MNFWTYIYFVFFDFLIQNVFLVKSVTLCDNSNSILTNSSGIISYPEGNSLRPMLYENNYQCNWTIILPENQRIRLKFDPIFQIEDGSNPSNDCNDFLEITDKEQFPYGNKLCGDLKPNDIYSRGNNLIAKFQSNGFRQKRGFTIYYSSVINSSKMFDEDCILSECNNAFGLICPNLTCECRDELYLDLETKDCYAKVGRECSFFEFIARCAHNSFCNKNGICECPKNYKWNNLNKTCEPKFDKKARDCKENCPGFLDQDCIDSKCKGNHTACSKHNKCICDINYKQSIRGEDCLGYLGQNCSDSDPCHEDFRCEKSKCNCKHKDQISSYIDNTLEIKCVSNLHGSCQNKENCPKNAVCDNSDKICKCELGYLDTTDGECLSGHLKPCDLLSNLCAPNTDLGCSITNNTLQKGNCVCKNLKDHQFDKIKLKCLGKPESHCKINQDCIGNMFCDNKTSEVYVNETVEINNEKTCKCADGDLFIDQYCTKNEPRSLSGKNWLAIGIGLFFGILIITATIVILVLYKKKYIFKRKILSEKEIENFLNGDKDVLENDMESEFKKKSFDPKYQILNSDLEINKSEILGSGEFGIVYKGKLLTEDDEDGLKVVAEKIVAVKTAKEIQDINLMRSLLTEIKIMLTLGQQENVIKFIGAVTQNIKYGTLYIVVEFCDLGNLKDYLIKERDNFKEENNSDETNQNKSKDSFDFNNLIKWSYETANGMEHLENKKVLHSDLAARNLLLTKDRKIKITDFGLSKKLYTEIYNRNNKTPLPWRWMALETLKDLNFSSKSDVWAYGILLWEIFTLGNVPYPGINLAQELITKLSNGYRLDKPEYATDKIFDEMTKCWEKVPEKRPNFGEIKEFFSKFINVEIKNEEYTTI